MREGSVEFSYDMTIISTQMACDLGRNSGSTLIYWNVYIYNANMHVFQCISVESEFLPCTHGVCTFILLLCHICYLNDTSLSWLFWKKSKASTQKTQQLNNGSSDYTHKKRYWGR